MIQSRTWTELSADEKGALVKPLFLSGHSYNEITRAVVAPNRGSVAGVIQRLRLRGELPPPDKSRIGREGNAAKIAQKKTSAQPPKQKRDAGLTATNIAVRAESRTEAPGIAISRAAAFEPIPGQPPVPFITNAGCKWPVDGADGNGSLACGASKEPEHVYCADHRRLAYVPRPIRKKAAAQVAERLS